MLSSCAVSTRSAEVESSIPGGSSKPSMLPVCFRDPDTGRPPISRASERGFGVTSTGSSPVPTDNTSTPRRTITDRGLRRKPPPTRCSSVTLRLRGEFSKKRSRVSDGRSSPMERSRSSSSAPARCTTAASTSKLFHASRKSGVCWVSICGTIRRPRAAAFAAR